MARSQMRHNVKDSAGNVIQNALCYVYETGTVTAVDDMYAAASGGSPITTLTSNAQGDIEAWFDEARVVDVKVTDNSDAAYYPSQPSNLLTWSEFTETAIVSDRPGTSRGVGLIHRLGANGDEPGAYVCFTPDDGYTQQVADIATLNALGVPTTLFLTRGWVDKAGTNGTWNDTYITTAQVAAIVAAGNEIGYHDNGDHVSQVSKYDALGAAGFEDYIEEYKAWALSTFGVTVTTGAYPGGISNARVREVTARELDYVRGTQGIVSRKAQNPLNVSAIDILAVAEATITGYVDTAIANRSLLVLLWHGGGDAAFRTKLANVVAYCEAAGVPMGTFATAMAERDVFRSTGTMVDAQGNAFYPQVRTHRIEIGADDGADYAYIDYDETNDEIQIGTSAGHTFVFENRVRFDANIIEFPSDATNSTIRAQGSGDLTLAAGNTGGADVILQSRNSGGTLVNRVRVRGNSDVEILDTAGNIVVRVTAAGALGFYAAAGTAKQTGVAVTAEAIHAALVTLGLIGA